MADLRSPTSDLPSSASPLRLSIINPLQSPDWDTQTENLPGATIFHRTAWARVLHETYGFTPLYFVAHAASGLRGVLPMMEVKSWLTGTRGVSLPFSDACTPLCADQATFDQLREQVEGYARERSWKYWEARGGGQFFDATAPSISYFEHTLALTLSEKELHAGLEPATRRAIRKAEKSGLIVSSESSRDAVVSYYKLHCHTRKRQGHPPQPFRFFERIHADILASGQGQIFIARTGSVPVAASIFFHDHDTAIYRFGASDERRQELRANNLLMWTAIRWYRDQGFARLHFGRTSLQNTGLRRFKASWGTHERLVHYFRYSLSKRRIVSVRDEATGKHRWLFRNMPEFVSRAIGRLFYKHIA